MVSIKDGDWFVEAGSYGQISDARKAIKVTAQMVFYRDSHREWRIRTGRVVFSGPDEAVTKRVVEQLRSSHALKNDECRRSAERMVERDKKIIADAVIAND